MKNKDKSNISLHHHSSYIDISWNLSNINVSNIKCPAENINKPAHRRGLPLFANLVQDLSSI